MSGNLRRLGFTGENLPDWHAEGACNGRSDVDWYARSKKGQQAAKRVCGGCNVKAVCLSDALDRREAFGVWGGMDSDERAAYAKSIGAARLTISEHGSRARYVGTRNTPGCRCDACRRAHADYEHARRWLARERKAAGWVAPQQACGVCSAMFTPRQSRHLYCSQGCAKVAADIQVSKREEAEQRKKRCSFCRKVRPKGRHRFCSDSCVQAAARKRAAKQRKNPPDCRVCGVELGPKRHRYCSDSCLKAAARERRAHKREMLARRFHEPIPEDLALAS